MKRIATFLLILLTFCCEIGWAQTRQVSGQVKKENSTENLSGVTVSVKGTNTSTLTNSEGRYSLAVPQNKDVILVFSYVGLKRQEVKVGTNSVVDVIMQDEVSNLDDVVVVGYQTVK